MVGKKQESSQKNYLDQDALVAIFDLYSNAIYKYALSLCRDCNEADQIVGDVFAQFMERVSHGEGPKTNLRSYLYQIAYHLVVDHAREKLRTVPIESAELQKSDESMPSQIEEQILLDELTAAIQNELTVEQKNVIILRFQENLSLRETADIMGKDVNAIKSLQKRGILKLQKSLVGRS
jgi:RNA polymerase sigma-70 factor (ECF subfamily)